MLIGGARDGHLGRENNETVILILIDSLSWPPRPWEYLVVREVGQHGTHGTRGTPTQMVVIRIISELLVTINRNKSDQGISRRVIGTPGAFLLLRLSRSLVAGRAG